MASFTAQRDPRVYALGVRAPAPEFKRALALDLGTNCGVAMADFRPGEPLVKQQIFMDQWDLSIGDYDSGVIRFVRLKQFLSIVSPDLIAYEDVKFTGSNEVMGRGGNVTAIIARVAKASEFIGALKATLTTWAEERNIPCQGFGIGEIKKFGTGRGNANKIDMIVAANKKFGTDFDPDTYEQTGVDNMVDAAFTLQMILEHYSQGLDKEETDERADTAPTRKRRTQSEGS